MSLLLVRASSQYLNYALPFDYNASYTLCGWWNATNTSLEYGVMELFGNASNLDIVYRDSVTNRLVLFSVDAGVASINGVSSASQFGVGGWWFLAMVRSGNTLSVYAGNTPNNVLLEITGTSAPGSRVVAVANLRLGADETPANFEDAAHFAWRAYTRALSLEELRREAAFSSAISGTSLWADWWLRTPDDLQDKSGNLRNFVVINGPAVLATDPPVVSPPAAIAPIYSRRKKKYPPTLRQF